MHIIYLQFPFVTSNIVSLASLANKTKLSPNWFNPSWSKRR